MDTQKHCSGCNKSLAPTAPQGLCPECLIKAGLGTGVDIGPETQAARPKIPFTPPKPEELAQHFPQLEILEFIGQGGMGAVYKVRQKQLDRIVALKILPPQVARGPGFAERFTREARALAKLNHPHIVTLYEFGEADELFYFLMEFVDGINLQQLLQTGRIAANEALAIVPQICDALQFAHQRGIVHRDIKPGNILLSKEGQVKIADFGVAKIVADGLDKMAVTKGAGKSSELTEAGSTLGTPRYMAPEQVAHPLEVDHRADIYSLGVVFYEMLTGELPGKKIEAPSKKVQIDVRLDEVVMRALEKTPELRWQTASDLRTQVETIAGTPEIAPSSQQIKRTKVISSLRFSRTAIAGAVWLPLFFITFILAFTERVIQGEYHGPTWWQILLRITLLPLGLAAPFGTTILGWIAVSQIRHSAGKLYGLGLAVFDGLFFPLLAFDGTIMWLLKTLSHLITDFYTNLSNQNNPQVHLPLTTRLVNFLFHHPELAVFVAIVAAIVMDFIIIRSVWRAVNQPLDDSSTIPPANSPSEPPVARAEMPSPRFSRTAIRGACWLPFSVFALLFILSEHGPTAGLNIIFVLPLILGFTAPFGTTILGWIAITQIRRSAGKYYGLGLAVFDGLFFPLLTLDGLIIAADMQGRVHATEGPAAAVHMVTKAWELHWWPTLLILGIIVLGDFLIIRYVWRVANQSLDPSPSIPRANDTSGQTMAYFALFFAGLSGVLSLVTFCFWPNPSEILVWSILIATLVGIILGVMTRKSRLGKRAMVVGGVNMAIWPVIAIVTQLAYATTQPDGAEIHYRVFVDEAGLVDKLIPVEQRQDGIMPNIKPEMFDGAVTAVSINGVFTKTDSQMAMIDSAALDALLKGMATKPGLLVDEKRRIPASPNNGIPGIPIGWTRGFADRSLSAEAVGGGFVKIQPKNGIRQVRIECRFEYLANNNPNLVLSKILYEGNAPQPGQTLAFFIPFSDKDNTNKYLVAEFEVSNENNSSSPNSILSKAIEQKLQLENFNWNSMDITFRANSTKALCRFVGLNKSGIPVNGSLNAEVSGDGSWLVSGDGQLHDERFTTVPPLKQLEKQFSKPMIEIESYVAEVPVDFQASEEGLERSLAQRKDVRVWGDSRIVRRSGQKVEIQIADADHPDAGSTNGFMFHVIATLKDGKVDYQTTYKSTIPAERFEGVANGIKPFGEPVLYGPFDLANGRRLIGMVIFRLADANSKSTFDPSNVWSFGPVVAGLQLAAELATSNEVFAFDEPITVKFHVRNA